MQTTFSLPIALSRALLISTTSLILATHAGACGVAPERATPESSVPSAPSQPVKPMEEPPSTTADSANDPDSAALPWATFRIIWFMSNRSSLDDSELGKIKDIVSYSQLNPAAQIALNRSTDFSGFAADTEKMNTLRLEAIRTALLAGGVLADRIHVGPVGNLPSSMDRRVVVLVRAGS